MVSLQSLANWLNSPAFSLWGNGLANAEVLGFLTGLWCVWLTVRKSIWNFPVGIANCARLLFLFAVGRLFADASLQVLFIVLGFYGWWQWSRDSIAEQVPVSRLSGPGLAAAGIGSIVLSAAIYAVLTQLKGSVPVFDASITGLSLIAQYLLNRHKLENWFFWILVDVISIPVYVHKNLYLVALLYALFLGLCVLGLRQWRRALPVPIGAAA